MNKTKIIYFLCAFVLIMGCYALNLSYSLFVQTEEQQVVDSYVPMLSSELSLEKIVLAAGEEYIVKQTITNTGITGMNYALNASSNATTTTIGTITEYTSDLTGTLGANESTDVYLYVKNTGASNGTITFSLNKNYDTVTSNLTSDIENSYSARGTDTLAYKVLGTYTGELSSQFGNTYVSNNAAVNSSTATSTVTFTPTKDGILSFNWEVSSETNYDKFSVTLNDTTVVSASSGKISGTVNESISSGTTYTLTFTYSKDSSVNNNGDKAIISDLFITSVENPEVVTTEGSYGFVDSLMMAPALGSGNNVNSTTPEFTGISTTADGIFAAEDDFGTSYYYRGAVTNNYVNFAGMCWKIIRINGNGSIKLILEDQDNTCESSDGNWNISTTTGGTTIVGNFGYTYGPVSGTSNTTSRYVMNYLHGETNFDTSMATAFMNFQENLNTKISSTYSGLSLSDKLETGNWCLADDAYLPSSSTPYTFTFISDSTALSYKGAGTRFNYDSYRRLSSNSSEAYNPIYKCNGTLMNDWDDSSNTLMYVGAITADEIVYAGGFYGETNENYYLINDYQMNNSLYIWTLSPASYASNYYGFTDFIFEMTNEGKLDYSLVHREGSYLKNESFRPVITLKNNLKVSSGTGTKDYPFVIQ